MWKPIRINRKRFRIHDLRHSFANHMVSRGVPLAVAGALMGHKRAETTQRYSHILDQAKRDALRLGIGAVYSGNKGSEAGQGPVGGTFAGNGNKESTTNIVVSKIRNKERTSKVLYPKIT